MYRSTYGCVQREKGLEKFDIQLQKLDEDDAVIELAARLEAEEAAHFNYASVSTRRNCNSNNN